MQIEIHEQTKKLFEAKRSKITLRTVGIKWKIMVQQGITNMKLSSSSSCS